MTQPAPIAPEVLPQVAAAAAKDAGGLDPGLLGDFLEVVVAAVAAGHRLTRAQSRRYQAVGQDAARRGVALRALLDLYLSAAWRLWRHLPAVAAQTDPAAVVTAGEVMLRAVDDAAAALAEGFQLARRTLVRSQESARREFIDELLAGRADVAGLLQRAAGFGLDLTGPHAVAVVRSDRAFAEGTALNATVERAVLGSKGDAEALVTSKEGLLVVVFACPDQRAADHVTARLAAVLGPGPDASDRVELQRRAGVGRWQIGLGRAKPGAEGVLSSYQEAREALDLARRLALEAPVVKAADLLVYRVLLRDRAAMAELVDALLTPLLTARGGVLPLLDTLSAYFASGGNATVTARHLHLSVRAVTYRLQRVADLTGHDPNRADQAFALQAAVLGARLLSWP